MNSFIPVRLPADDPVTAPKFRIKWTPSLLILDQQGQEHYRTMGFFWPQELIPSLMLGIGKTYFNLADRNEATSCFEEIINGFPECFQREEAIYLNGVSRFIETHDAANLIGIYDRLVSEYPKGSWAMRADPYRLLKKK